MIKRIINKFFDYRIVGEYYEPVEVEGRIVQRKKYLRKYYWKGSRKHGK